MKQMARTTNRAMTTPIFAVMCYAYMFLGVCSIVAGGLVYAIPLFLGLKHARHIDAGMGFIIVVLVGFGLARVVTAITNLRRIRRGAGRSSTLHSKAML